MKTVIKFSFIKSVILAALVAAVGVSAAEYAPRTATEAIFFSHGFIDAYAEGEDNLLYLQGVTEANAQGESVASSPLYRTGFLTMAWANAALARSFSTANSFDPSYGPVLAYFNGRAAAFFALAEKYGE